MRVDESEPLPSVEFVVVEWTLFKALQSQNTTCCRQFSIQIQGREAGTKSIHLDFNSFMCSRAASLIITVDTIFTKGSDPVYFVGDASDLVREIQSGGIAMNLVVYSAAEKRRGKTIRVFTATVSTLIYLRCTKD